MKTSNANGNGGFTLLEVLVALAVLAIAMVTLVKASAVHTGNAAYLQQRTFAQWVALNVINDYRIDGGWPDEGQTTGHQQMASQDWYWRARIKPTDDDNLRQIEVDVALEHERDRTLAQVNSYLAKPYRSGATP